MVAGHGDGAPGGRRFGYYVEKDEVVNSAVEAHRRYLDTGLFREFVRRRPATSPLL